MPQSNSKTQNIFPCGNIFVPVQTNNIRGEVCSSAATQQARLIVGIIYIHPALTYRKKTQVLVLKASIIAGIKFELHQRNLA